MHNDARPSILAGGQFMGNRRSNIQLPDFSLSHLVPTVPEDEVPEHTHTEAHYVLFLAGRYVSTAHGAPTVSPAPMLIYNPPGTVHRDRFRGEGGRFFTLAVSAAAVSECAAALPSYALTLDGPAFSLALRIAKDAQQASGDALHRESLCTELLALTAAVQESALDAAPGWLRRARELLHDDCGRDLVLADVARALGVHPVHLTRVFRRHLRCTPGEYLRRCRLDRAAALLRRGVGKLSEVAQVCGYFDQAHFSNAFRQAYGMSPRAYRQGLMDTRP